MLVDIVTAFTTTSPTYLACSLGEVRRRVADQDFHTAPFSTEPDPGELADAFRNAIYADERQESYFGIPAETFVQVFNSKRLVCAPDGDTAFDESSYVLHFDVEIASA